MTQEHTHVDAVINRIRNALPKEFPDEVLSNTLNKYSIRTALDRIQDKANLSEDQKTAKLIYQLAMLQFAYFKDKPCKAIAAALRELGIDEDKKEKLEELTQQLRKKAHRALIARCALESFACLAYIALAIRVLSTVAAAGGFMANQTISSSSITNVDIGVLAALGAVCLVSAVVCAKEKMEIRAERSNVEAQCFKLATGREMPTDQVEIEMQALGKKPGRS